MDGCLLWPWARDRSGYGRCGFPHNYAHRRAWAERHGPIAEGLVVHHRCGERACVNVEHLELKDRAQHVREHRAAERELKPPRSPEEKRQANAEAQRAWLARQRQAGRCTRCLELAEPGKRQCPRHLEADRLRRRSR